jgi:hypothetical protein
MKIVELLSFSISLTNEEYQFLESHPSKFSIAQLMDKDQLTARNLVRKGIYEISNDSQYLIKKTNEKNS